MTENKECKILQRCSICANHNSVWLPHYDNPHCKSVSFSHYECLLKNRKVEFDSICDKYKVASGLNLNAVARVLRSRK